MEISFPASSSSGFSHPVPAWRVTAATIQKNLHITFRYLPNLLGNLVEMAVRVVFFLLLSNTISMQGGSGGTMALSGHNLYVFLLGSLSLFVFTRSTLWGPINAVNNDLYNGTLEYLYSGPGSRYAYYVGVVISEVLVSLVVFVPIFILMVALSGASLLNLGLMLLACLLVLVSLTAMGIMISILALVWKQVGSVASVLGILFELVAGAYLPLSAFPRAVQYFSYLLPFTWGYDILRYYSLGAQAWRPILPIAQEWAVIALFALVFTLVSRYLLGKAERLAKKQGLHII